MKPYFILIPTLLTCCVSLAQNVYTITADTVKMTSCDSTELVLKNHTQAVPGFLFNTGGGRTAFQRPLTKINDTLYLVGADTLKMSNPNAWLQGGNAFGTTGVLGTLDNNHLDFYTNNTRAARLDSLGNLLLETSTEEDIKWMYLALPVLLAIPSMYRKEMFMTSIFLRLPAISIILPDPSLLLEKCLHSAEKTSC